MISKTRQAVEHVVDRARRYVKENPDTVRRGGTVAAWGSDVVTYTQQAIYAARHRVSYGTIDTAKLANPSGSLSLFGKLRLAGGALGLVTGIAILPRYVATASADLRRAVREGSREAAAKAGQSSLWVAKSATVSIKGAIDAAAALGKLRITSKAAAAAFRATAPHASEAVVKAAARAAAKATFEGSSRQVVRAATRSAARAAAKSVTGSAVRAATTASLQSASHAAASAAARASAHSAAGGFGRAAARFAPGVNVALAVVDTGLMVATLADPKASTSKKVWSVLTAAGSIVAATNIPIVSQVGASLSVVSTVAGAF